MPQRLPPNTSPTTFGLAGQIVAATIGILLMFAMLMIGFTVFLAVFALALVLWFGFSVRRWWSGSSGDSARQGHPSGSAKAGGQKGDVLDGEFEVLDKQSKKDE